MPSRSGEYVAMLGSRYGNHHLRILREGKTVLDKEIWFDGMESGIAGAQWSPDGSKFAVKVCGDGDLRIVTIFDVSNGRDSTFQGAELSLVPAWTGFDDSRSFDKHLDTFWVGDKSNPN